MRLDDLPSSENIEDRRSDGGGYGPGGFGLGPRGGLGIGTIVVLGLIGWVLGIDPRLLIGGAEILNGGGSSYEQPYPGPQPSGIPGSDTAKRGAPSDPMGRFVSLVLGSTEIQWKELFAQSGKTYEPPTLVVFLGATRSACGFAQSAMGSVYCPNNLRFTSIRPSLQDLERRFRACDSSKACQFSEAYVIAHEVGHHVQNLFGILPRTQQLQQGLEKAQANRVQVRVELQADCRAGVWAFHAEEKWRLIEPGDVESALQTASAIGDGRLSARPPAMSCRTRSPTAPRRSALTGSTPD
jgi:predicted metalloprotease